MKQIPIAKYIGFCPAYKDIIPELHLFNLLVPTFNNECKQTHCVDSTVGFDTLQKYFKVDPIEDFHKLEVGQVIYGEV